MLLALASSATSLANGFAIDDVIIIAGDIRIHRLGTAWRVFGQTYWPPPATATLYRPLTSLAFAVEWALGGGAAWAYHAANVALYVLVCLAVYRLSARLVGRTAGWWAAALFAVHPVHVEVVGNAVGQAELWAGLCVLTAVTRYVTARKAGWLARSDVMLVLTLYALGCLFKEHAIMLPALLIAAEATVLRGHGTGVWRRREVHLLGLGLAGVAAGFWLRHVAVTGTLAGDRPSWAFVGVSPRDRILTMLGVAPEWARLLWVPAHLQMDYMPQEVSLAHGVGVRQMAGIAVLIGMVALTIAARRRRPELAFALLWVMITLFPVSNLVLVSGVTLAERTLFLPSVGAVLAVGALVSRLLEWATDRGVAWRWSLAALGVVVLAAACVRSALRQPVWRNSRSFEAQALRDSPRSYRSHWWRGKRLYLAQDLAGAQHEFALALSLFDGDPRMLSNIADHYGTLNRCAEAIGLYRRSLSLAPEQRWLHRRIVRCLADLGRLGEARREVDASLARHDPFIQDEMARLDSLARAAGVPADSER